MATLQGAPSPSTPPAPERSSPSNRSRRSKRSSERSSHSQRSSQHSRRSRADRPRKARRRAAPPTDALELLVGDLALPRIFELAAQNSPFATTAWAATGPLKPTGAWLDALCCLGQTCRAVHEAARLNPDRDLIDGVRLLRLLHTHSHTSARHGLWALPRELRLVPAPRPAARQLPGFAGSLLAHLEAPLERLEPELRAGAKCDVFTVANRELCERFFQSQLQPTWNRVKCVWKRERLQGMRAALHLLGIGLCARAAAIESMRNTLHPSAGGPLCVRRCRGCERDFLCRRSIASENGSLLRALVHHVACARPELARRRTFRYWAAGLLGSRPAALEPQREGDDALLGGATWLFCCAPCEARFCQAAWAPLLRAGLGPDALCEVAPTASLGAEVEAALRRNERAREALQGLHPSPDPHGAQELLCRAVSFALDLDAALLLVSESNRAVHRPCCVAAGLPGVAQNWRAHSVRSELWHEVAVRLQAAHAPRFTRRESAHRTLHRALGCAVALVDGITAA